MRILKAIPGLQLPVRIADGGRAAAGLAGKARRDCVCRAVAIASGRPYGAVWQELADLNARAGKRRSAAFGVVTGNVRFTVFMSRQGFSWQPTKDETLPSSPRFIVDTVPHYFAVVDGVIHDAFNPLPRYARQQVRGYWVPS